MFKLGLTGSIGMGKSTTAQMFVQEGCALWDADAAVHRVYGKNGAAVAPIGALFPQAIENGEVSRAALKDIIRTDPLALDKIERIVHPLLVQDRADFVSSATADILVFDIPLLFETGANTAMDAVASVFVSAQEQERRVLARGTMAPETFAQILAKQMPAEEKCARSDFVIEADTVENARAQVQDIVSQIRERKRDA